jgi:hypothetical protein
MIGVKGLLERWVFNHRQDESVPVFIIRPSKGLVALNLRELWQYRELLYILIWRDIKVRYKQTAVGAAWAVIQPFGRPCAARRRNRRRPRP